MNKIKKRRSMVNAFKDREYREAFIAESINTGIPFQILALREQRNWTQKELGEYANMAQETISRIEDPNYGKLSLTTLKRIASAFDIGLLVKFVSFSDLVEREINLSPDSLWALSFSDDPYFKESEEIPSENHEQYTTIPVMEITNNNLSSLVISKQTEVTNNNLSSLTEQIDLSFTQSDPTIAKVA